MVDYGTAHSMERPITPDVKLNKVFVAENIEEEQVPVDKWNDETEEMEQEFVTGYKFRLLEYTKDEYIALLHSQITDTQLALCEIYEELV